MISNGDFGYSDYAYGTKVSEGLWRKVLVTVKITILAYVLCLIFGFYSGIIYAISHNKYYTSKENIIGIISSELMAILLYLITSIPAFIIGYFVIGISKSDTGIIICSFTLAFGSGIISEIYAHIRKSMNDEFNNRYIETALAKGLPITICPKKGSVTLHAVRNIIPTLIPFFSSKIPYFVGVSFIIEIVYEKRGIGSVLLSRLMHQDIPAILSIIVILVIIVRVITIITEILILVMNPRIIYDE